VEVMIAIAIALLLIVGISQLFAIAQRTTSTGTSLLEVNLKQRSMQTVFNGDFHALVSDSAESPGFVIASYAAKAFRNQSDFDTATDQNDPGNFGPTYASVPGLSQAYTTSSRIHRLDRMGIFGRDVYHRQTADAPALSSFTTSNEAFIWYGHLALPNNPEISNWDPLNPGGAASAAAAWFNPGAPDGASSKNDNDLFASSWILGRVVTLLAESITTEEQYPFVNFVNVPPAPNTAIPLSLLPPVSQSNISNTPAFASRFDLSFNPISQCRQTLAQNTRWWANITGMTTVGGIGSPITADQRYFANPFPTKGTIFTAATSGPWLSASAAQTTPIFLRGCTQFIVEFAGNFVTQDQNNATSNTLFGRVSAPTPDPTGKLDFIPARDAAGNWTRQTRWYGFPRDVNGTDASGGAIIGKPEGTLDINDVIPLRTFLTALGYGGTPVPFERTVPTLTLPTTTMNFRASIPGALPQASEPYVAAWGQDTLPWSGVGSLPKLIRITIAVDEPNGRLNNEQTFEYIFTMPN
jgi:hypothetical protein